MAGFDPYLIWLDIPAHERPATYYRLFGLRPLENDPQVIAAAAQRVITHVSRFQQTEHAAACNQVLAELTAARDCLLNPMRKQAYDSGFSTGDAGPAIGVGERPLPGPAGGGSAQPGISPQQRGERPITQTPQVPGRTASERQIRQSPPVPGSGNSGGFPPGGNPSSGNQPTSPLPSPGYQAPVAGGEQPLPSSNTPPSTPPPPGSMNPPAGGSSYGGQPAHPPAGHSPQEQLPQPGSPQPTIRSPGPIPSQPQGTPAGPPSPPSSQPHASPPGWASGQRTGEVQTVVAGQAAPQHVSNSGRRQARRIRRSQRNQSAYLLVGIAMAMIVFFFGAVLLLAIFLGAQ